MSAVVRRGGLPRRLGRGRAGPPQPRHDRPRLRRDAPRPNRQGRLPMRPPGPL